MFNFSLWLGTFWVSFVLGTGVLYAEQPCSGRPVRLIVPFAAGTSSDSATRVLAKSMETRLSQPLVIVNMPGAGGQVAAAYLSTAAADGCTIGSFSTSPVTLHAFKKIRAGESSYNPSLDFSFIGGSFEIPFVLVVNSELPVLPIEKLAEYAKTNDKAYAFGISFAMADATVSLVRDQYEMDISLIPYCKGDVTSVSDLLSNRIQGSLMTLGVALPYIQSGQLRALFVVSRKRKANIPSVPTMSETDLRPGLVKTWQGILGPPGLPAEYVETFNRALRGALSDPEVVEGLDKLGIEPNPSTSRELEKRVRDGLPAWVDLFSNKKVQCSGLD